MILNCLKKVCDDCFIKIIDDFNPFNKPDHFSWHILFNISDINQENIKIGNITNELIIIIKKKLIISLNSINKNIVCIGYYKENNIYYVYGLGCNKLN